MRGVCGYGKGQHENRGGWSVIQYSGVYDVHDRGADAPVNGRAKAATIDFDTDNPLSPHFTLALTGTAWTERPANLRGYELSRTNTGWRIVDTRLRIADGAGAAVGEIRFWWRMDISPTTDTNRDISFQLQDGVEIFGGYAGWGTANPDARDIALYPTILSGDIGIAGNNSDNTYHVMVGSNTDSSAILDGFTILAATPMEMIIPLSVAAGCSTTPGARTYATARSAGTRPMPPGLEC